MKKAQYATSIFHKFFGGLNLKMVQKISDGTCGTILHNIVYTEWVRSKRIFHTVSNSLTYMYEITSDWLGIIDATSLYISRYLDEL